MSGPVYSFPSTAEGLCLHARLCRPDDPQATTAVVEAYLQPLLDFLQGRYPQADEDLWLEAVHRTLLDYLKSPERFCPDKSALGTYLRRLALCDLRNLLRREARHQRGRVSFFLVENGAAGGNNHGGEEEPSELLCRQEEAALCQELLCAVEADCSAEERCILDLMRAGRAGTANCVAALNIGHLSADEQVRHVKRVKDRIKKRIERRRSA